MKTCKSDLSARPTHQHFFFPRAVLERKSEKTKNAWPKNARPKLLGEPAQCETAKQSKCEQRATQQVVKKKKRNRGNNVRRAQWRGRTLPMIIWISALSRITDQLNEKSYTFKGSLLHT